MTRNEALKEERKTGKAADNAGAVFYRAEIALTSAAKKNGNYSKAAKAAKKEVAAARKSYRAAYAAWQKAKRNYDAIVEREDWS